jgi:hypothetical protein
MSFSDKRALHLKILQSAGSIESWDLAKRCELMDNTSNKYVKYLRDEGHTILTERIEGKSWCSYKYISGPSVSVYDADRLAAQYLEAAKTYPEGHPQRKKIMQDYEKMIGIGNEK